MVERLRRLPLVDVGAAGYVAAFYVWLALRAPGTQTTAFIGDLVFLPLGLAVAWATWRTGRMPGLDVRTRVAWRLLTAAYLSLWLSGSAWTFYIRTVDSTHWPWWIDQFEFVQHVFALAAYLTFPNRRLGSEARTRFLADASLTLVAGAVLAFHFVLRVALQQGVSDVMEVTIAGAVLDWLLFATASMGLVQKRDPEIRQVMGILLAANTVYLFANYVYAQHAGGYRIGDAADGLWFAAWVLRWAAARRAWRLYAAPDRAPERAMAGYQSNTFSYAIVALAFVLLITQIVAGDRQFLWFTASSVAVMAFLLLFRQFAELGENRRLFAAQLAQEARFRSLVQHSSDVVLIVEPDGVIAYASPSSQRLVGSDRLRPGRRLHDLVEDHAALRPIFEQPGASRPLLHRMRTADGSWREVEIVWSDLLDDPAVNGIVLNCRDVTERNELERHLQHAQKLDAVGHLAGGLAHDFNNLLTVIRGYTELLRGDLPPEARACAEDLGYMEQAVDRAAAVTKKLLAFSRRQPVQATVVDVNGVLGELEPLFRQLLPDGVEVVLECTPLLWQIKVDQGQIEQVLINLATNARDAMPQGGRLHIQTANHVVMGDHAPPGGPDAGDYIQLTVSDTGIGMDDETVGHIFDPFFSTKPKDRGMGLGLAMVHGIVTGAGGAITVASAPGRGTTFTILLPRTGDRAVLAASQESAPEAATEPRTVLIVDDEQGVRNIVRRLLERGGYRVLEASDGRSALTFIDRSEVHIDLLLTDMVMPGMHGRELIARFRAKRPGLPVISMSGFTGEMTQARDASPELAGVLTKPFSSDTLIRAVSAVAWAS
jgi:PAS domain S-box-containing protein